MPGLLAIWIINAGAAGAPWLVPSIQIASFAIALALAAVPRLINAILRPLPILLTPAGNAADARLHRRHQRPALPARRLAVRR